MQVINNPVQKIAAAAVTRQSVTIRFPKVFFVICRTRSSGRRTVNLPRQSLDACCLAGAPETREDAMRFGRTYGNHFKGTRRRFAPGSTSPAARKRACSRAVLRRLCRAGEGRQDRDRLHGVSSCLCRELKIRALRHHRDREQAEEGLRRRRLPISDGARGGGV